jgi:hypothetical protein
MLATIVRQSIQQSHGINAILSMRSDWSDYYVCGAAFDVAFAPSLNPTTNSVVEATGKATRSLLRQMRGEGKPTNNIGFHVPVNRERGKRAK